MAAFLIFADGNCGVLRFVDPVRGRPSRRLLSLAQLYTALIANYGLFLGLSLLRSRTVSGLFLSVAVLMLLVATLEVYFGIKPFVDAVRSVIHQQYHDDTARDVQLYGAVRLTVFPSEPSLAGIFWGLSLCGWLLADVDRFGLRRLVVASLLTAAAVFVTRRLCLSLPLLRWTNARPTRASRSNRSASLRPAFA
jgi:hypothetical protein